MSLHVSQHILELWVICGHHPFIGDRFAVNRQYPAVPHPFHPELVTLHVSGTHGVWAHNNIESLLD